MAFIRIVEQINLNETYQALSSYGAGAVNLFIGTVRDQNRGKSVTELYFEAYEPMAIRQMELIAARAALQWPLEKIVMVHATGAKRPGAPVVVTGVSSAHREASFEACRFLIEELKKTVPIWKKEFYEDGSIWINAHP